MQWILTVKRPDLRPKFEPMEILELKEVNFKEILSSELNEWLTDLKVILAISNDLRGITDNII